jgi:hypothetical protein
MIFAENTLQLSNWAEIREESQGYLLLPANLQHHHPSQLLSYMFDVGVAL